MTTPPPFILHRSSVNAWECDENGHLNVRYFVKKNSQALLYLLAESGLGHAELAAHKLSLRIASQHIRFHREAHLAAPLIISGQLVEHHDSELELYSELRNSMDNTLYTTFNTTIGLSVSEQLTPAPTLSEFHSDSLPVPDYGAIRSLHQEPAIELSIDEALAIGYVETGRGVVTTDECEPDACLAFYQYAGRIADAIPNFMATMQSEEEFSLRATGKLGGAVIESRADYYSELACGERLIILSGLRSFTSKTQRLSHLIFALDAERLIAHSQGIAVALDLETRRAVKFSEDRRTRMQARQLKES